jgi:hypothetical protein
MGPDPENRVGDQENGSPGRPVSSGLQSARRAVPFLVGLRIYQHPVIVNGDLIMPRNLRHQKCILGTFLITQWNRVHLEKLTGSQLVKKFPEFYRTRRFITAFTSACHLSLS